ncbi:MAG: hypothetical protein ACOY6K_04760 [Pseudomonadota bacterium]
MKLSLVLFGGGLGLWLHIRRRGRDAARGAGVVLREGRCSKQRTRPPERPGLPWDDEIGGSYSAAIGFGIGPSLTPSG